MTYEEAIKVLNDTRVMIIKGSATDLQKASYMAVESLKKQIPKKVKGKGADAVCSECNSGLFRNDRYCWKCGQAIDWSE